MLRLLAIFCATVLGGTAQAQNCDGRLVKDTGVYAAPLCLPENPERVVVLDASFGLGVGLDADLPIVGAPLDRLSDADLARRAREAGVESIGFVTEPSLETIVAMRPDLIVGYVGSESMASGIYPQVAQLAPTLLYADTDWRRFYRLVAGFTGRTAEVEAGLEELEARIADLRARMPDIPVSVLRITSWDFQVYLDSPDSYAPFELMREAGVRRTDYETTNDPDLGMKRPDWEELAELDGEVLLYIVGGTNASDEDGRHEEVLSNPLWQMLPAVRSGEVHRVDHGHWMQFSGIGAAYRVLDDLERYVIGAE